VIVVTLIGFHVAGFTGALVATLAMCGPTCVFAFYASRMWDRFKNAPWHLIIQAGMVPVSLGLLAASSLVIVQVAARSWVAAALTAFTAVVTFKLRVNPLWIFAGAALVGLTGAI
jgi:chromate transporter